MGAGQREQAALGRAFGLAAAEATSLRVCTLWPARPAAMPALQHNPASHPSKVEQAAHQPAALLPGVLLCLLKAALQALVWG